MIINDRQIRYFLFSQYLADGIRMTLEIILPVILFLYLGRLDIGITIASGAFCISICDIPGPVKDKRNGMLYSIGFVGIMSFLTGLVNEQIIGMGLLIMAASFFFSMIGVFGNRASSAGTAALLIMIIRMKDTVPWTADLTDSLLVMLGGAWYMAIAMLFNQLAPFRPAQRALGECLHETATYLSLKSAMYETNSNQEDIYKQLLTQQVSINEKQEIARELIFKNREATKEPSRTGRLLLITFIQSVDLFERVGATWYDYKQLRERFGKTGLLDDVSVIIKKMAAEIDHIGLAIQSNKDYHKNYDWLSDLDILKAKVDALEDSGSHLVLKKILVNLRQIGEMTDGLLAYFSSKPGHHLHTPAENDLFRFVSHQDIDPVILRNNLTLKSSSFRHALRMMITCVAAYIISLIFHSGPHSYWIILTVIIILKPGFSLTRQRNRERIIGTAAGGIIAFFILYYIRNTYVLFGLVVLCMIATYTYQRLNYMLMVIFITPYLIIMLHLLDMGFTELVGERMLDTAIAFMLGFAANYYLFPNWESRQLQQLLSAVTSGTLSYIDKLLAIYSGQPPSTMDYRLARKELFVSNSNLSAAFHRMLSEPKSKQTHIRSLYEFMALNQLMASNITSLAPGTEHWGRSGNRIMLSRLKRIRSAMSEVWMQLEKKEWPTEPITRNDDNLLAIQPDHSITEQLDFMYKVALDIRKTGLQLSIQDEERPVA